MAIAEQHDDVILTCDGGMMRVPGSNGSFLDANARGADIRIVYSPLDALRIARDNPDRQVIFYAIGFETTALSTALTLPCAPNRRSAIALSLVGRTCVGSLARSRSATFGLMELWCGSEEPDEPDPVHRPDDGAGHDARRYYGRHDNRD
jgi:hypothetical protein